MKLVILMFLIIVNSYGKLTSTLYDNPLNYEIKDVKENGKIYKVIYNSLGNPILILTSSNVEFATQYYLIGKVIIK